MTARVLLVTGSRVLADRLDVDDVREWVVRELERAVREHGIDTIVCGDARGPDDWAADFGHRADLTTAVYAAQSGAVFLSKGFDSLFARPWLENIEPLPPNRRPLYRNAIMCEHVARKDPRAVVHAFIDASPARRTRGTEHTLSCARSNGLTNVTVHVWGYTKEGGARDDQA